MTEALVGVLGTVDDVPAGNWLFDDHAAGETVLRLEDAADFAETGGLVEVDGHVLVYDSADLATDVLTLAQPLPADVESATAVYVSPRAPTRVATVLMDGQSDGLDAAVPQSLLDQVRLGLRSGESAETVRVGLVDGRWTVTDLVAVPSQAVDTEWVEGLEDRLDAARAQLDDAAAWIADTGADLDARLVDAQAGLDEARTGLEEARGRLDRAFASLEDLEAGVAAAGGTVWRQDTPPAVGTTYRWTGTPHASASEKVVDGVVVATNVLLNPGAERANGWTSNNQARLPATWDTSVSRSGGRSRRSELVAGQTDARVLSLYAVGDNFPVGPGQQVAARVHCRAGQDGYHARTRLQFLDASDSAAGSVVVGGWAPAPAGSWTPVTVEGTAPAGSTQARLFADILSVTGNATPGHHGHVDDAIVVIDEPLPAGYFDGDTPDEGADLSRDLWIDTSLDETGTPRDLPHTWTDGAWIPVRTGVDLGQIRASGAVVDDAVIDALTARIATIIEARIENLVVTEGATISDAVIEALWAQVVRSRKITTDMLLVGSGENLVPDPSLTDADLTAARVAASDGAWAVVTYDGAPTLAASAPGVWRAVASAEDRYYRIEPGHPYRVRYQAHGVPTGSFGFYPTSRPVVRWVDASGAAHTTYPDPAYVQSQEPWQWREVTWTAPQDAVGAYVGIQTHRSADFYARYLGMTSKVDPAMIVDGSLAVALDVAAGGQVTAGTLEAGGRAFLRGGADGGIGFEATEEGGGVVALARMGRDWVSRDGDGIITASVTGAEGEFAGRVGDFGTLSVAGTDVTARVTDGARGLIVSDDTGYESRGPYGQQTGYREIGFEARPGYAYRIECVLHAFGTGNTLFGYLHRRMRAGLDVPPPLVTDTAVASDDAAPQSGVEARLRLSETYVPAGNGRNVRVLVSGRSAGSGTIRFGRAVTTVTEVEHTPLAGATGRWSGGGAPGAPVPLPAVPPQVTHRWVDLNWVQVYDSGGQVAPATPGTIWQGMGGMAHQSPLGTMLRIGDTDRLALVGGGNVQAWLQVTNISPRGGSVVVGRGPEGETGRPAQFSTFGPQVVGSVSLGQTALLPLPGSWAPLWSAGSLRLLTVGRVGTTGQSDPRLSFWGTDKHANIRARLYFQWEQP